MVEFFQSAYGIIATIAAAAAMFWGLFKAGGALKKWLLAKYQNHKSKKNQPIEELTKVINKRFDDMQLQISNISTRLQSNDDSTATVMLQKMMWAYYHYVLANNPIPLAVQTALCVMYDQYVKNEFHNHIPSDFKEKIMACQVIGLQNISAQIS